jgi:hypothetical protein
MKEDPELLELEQLYTDAGLPKSEQTPERLAQQIREQARRKAAETLESAGVVRLASRKPITLKMVSGFSLAAGVLLGILLPLDFLQQENGEIGQQVSPPIFMGQEELQEELSELDLENPRVWQKLIMDTVVSGDMDKAQVLIEEFNRRFPDYDPVEE